MPRKTTEKAAELNTPAYLLRRRAENIPPDLRRLPAWVAWRYGPERDNGKRAKVPIDPATGRSASVSDPVTWGRFAQALERCERDELDGIGFVLADDDEFSCVDQDGCRDPETKNIDPKTLATLRMLDSYSEVSPSGTGVHTWVRGKAGTLGKKPIEVYSRKGFIAGTGRRLSEFPGEIKQRTRELSDLLQKQGLATVSASAPERTLLAATDQYRRVRREIIASRDGAVFEALWDGDWTGYRSQSEADLALCRILAPRSGCREDVVDGLFRESELFREKWDESHYEDGRTYGEETVTKAVESAMSQLKERYAVHSLATVLITEEHVDPKTAQGILRHASSDITMDIYTHAQDEAKRKAL